MKQRGMTLIEVMVALLILASAGLALVKTSQEQVRNLDYLQQKQIASWVADNQLTLLRLMPSASTAVQQGESLQLGRRWYWRARQVATSQPGMLAIEIAVSDRPDATSPLIRLHSWQLR
ncbi:type II secretion system minor pseudopilin GspI [Pantoea dispersa]|uniref:type II secretion system minor pseudopilin GspI n=1 Tax=Pantoea dispersa TaxID=59814 RepID=UPI0039B66707